MAKSPRHRTSPSPLKESIIDPSNIKKVDHEISFNFSKCAKKNLMLSLSNHHNHSVNCVDSDLENEPEVVNQKSIDKEEFCKPSKKRIKSKKRARADVSPCNTTSENTKVLTPLEKLGVRYDEFKSAALKSRQAFSSYKVATFFCLKTEFIRDFGNNLLKVEESVNEMGAALNKILDKSPIPILNLEELSAKDSLSSNPVEGGSLTPPSSEVGANDHIALFDEDQNASKKRKLSLSSKKNDTTNPSRKARKCLEDLNDERNAVITIESKEEKEVSLPVYDETKGKENTEAAPEEEEYEVSKIKDYTKRQGQFVYRVSWRGYDTDDDTYEPADNLTGCDEALTFFFQMRLLDRLNSTMTDELKYLSLPCTDEVRDLMLESFEKIVLPLNEVDEKRMTSELLKSKLLIRKREELKDDIIKFINMKDPNSDRYIKLKALILNSIRYQTIHEKREKQLAHLRSWERNINTICSDPSPITVENNIDLAYPSMDFKYINSYLAGCNITIPNDPMVGCECGDCTSSSKGCCAEQMSSSFAYNKYGRLRISLGIPIYECNKMCKCPPECPNRIVQKGRKVALSIFRTENGRGWGVKTLEAIKKDSFLSEYVGEVISSEEAERRGKKYDAQGCTYLFDLDYNKGELNPYTIDAAKYGNVSHFINHSCDPNLAVYNVWVDCLDPDLPRLALFAVADIKKGEELTFDYNSGSNKQMTASIAERMDENGLVMTSPLKTAEGENSMSSFSSPSVAKTTKSRTLNAGKTECRCGAVNCRKFFF